MVEKIGEWDWEDEISDGIQQLVVQDKETGECWPVETKETDCSTLSDKLRAVCSRKPTFKPCWKVPKEYSLLGCNTSLVQAESIQPVLTAVRVA